MRFNKCILLVIYAIIAIVVFTPLYAENSRTTICTLKTKYALNRIQNNRTTRSKHRIKTIYNRTQLKKNIQRNKQKK